MATTSREGIRPQMKDPLGEKGLRPRLIGPGKRCKLARSVRRSFLQRRYEVRPISLVLCVFSGGHLITVWQGARRATQHRRLTRGHEKWW